MPLKSGNDQTTISSNISELTHHGSHPRSHDQIVAIALANARRHPRADGGAVVERALTMARQAARQRGGVANDARPVTVGIPKLAVGGAPEYARGGQSSSDHLGGLVNSPGPGRTDIHNVDVPAGSYVLPADVVSGLGEGNTMAGSNVIEKMLNTGPYGIKMPQLRSRNSIPNPPAAFNDMSPSVGFHPPRMGFAEGGASKEMIPIVIAGGEFVVRPEDVAQLGGGDIKRGHAILDAFVKHIRKKTIKTLKKLPGPVV